MAERDALPPPAMKHRVLVVATVAATLSGFLRPLANHMAGLGWQLDAVAAGASDHSELLDDFGLVSDVPWSRRPLDPRNLLAVARLRRIILEQHYEIVHLHTPVAAFFGRLAVRSLPSGHRPRVIYTAHGFHFHRLGSSPANLAYVSAERIAGRWTDALVVINRDDEEAARRFRLVAPSKLHRIAGIGVDTKRFSPDAVRPSELEMVRKSLKVAPNTPLITCVAEFTPNKRHSYLLRAFARMRRSDAHLVLVGDGGGRTRQTRELAIRLGIDARVHFLGLIADVRPILRASNGLVLASLREGLPVSVMEAMSLRVPVVGTAVRGTTELLEDGCGLLVPPHDLDALAAALDDLATRPEMFRQMTARAQQKVEADLSTSSILTQYEALYEAVRSGGRTQD